jgi:hypothetical protein
MVSCRLSDIVGFELRRILPRAHLLRGSVHRSAGAGLLATLALGGYMFLVGNGRDIDMNRGFVPMGGVTFHTSR